jgi:hypothetical protein
MQCDTIKKGKECSFMGKRGCSFNDGKCKPIVDSCSGCSKSEDLPDGTFCLVAPDPAAKWSRGSCNFASHVERKIVEQTQKINPLKASKRSAGSKK